MEKNIVTFDLAKDNEWNKAFIKAMKNNEILRTNLLTYGDARKYYIETEKKIILDKSCYIFRLVEAKDNHCVASFLKNNFDDIPPGALMFGLSQICSFMEDEDQLPGWKKLVEKEG